MIDSPKDKGSRARLVSELRHKGIDDENVLKAFMNVPRHFFVPVFLQNYAYEDSALPIACNQTISQPFTSAKQTQLLEVEKKQKILEIGTGSGFQAAILKYMGAYIYSVERQRDLYKEAEQRFKILNLHIVQKFGDGNEGWDEFAPFDRILVTCAASSIPEKLFLQLKNGGIMLVPVGEGKQVMTKIIKRENGNHEISVHGDYSFVPMLQDKEMGSKK